MQSALRSLTTVGMPPHPDTWLKVLPDGLYCDPGGFYIDPLRPVDRAVITHAHADHARPGHAHVLASAETLAIMRVRMGEDRAGVQQQALRYGEVLTVGEVRVWLQPAGHVLGASQVAMEWRGSRAVVSGDYKRVADPTCAPFEPIPCDVFVTEATFALPVFHHPPPAAEIAKLLASVTLFPERTHVVGAYALGKCQRVIALLRQAGLGPADLPARRPGPALRGVRTARRASGRPASGDGGGQGGAGGRDRHRAARCDRGPLGKAAGGAGRVPRLGLDAGAATCPVARGRAPAGDQ